MKVSDGFDARRLRPKGPGSWGMRLGAGMAALLATFGVLLTMAGVKCSGCAEVTSLANEDSSAGGGV